MTRFIDPIARICLALFGLSMLLVAVGQAVPASITRDLGGPLRERGTYDTDGVSPRAAVLGGVLLVVFAIFFPWFRPRPWRDIPERD
jgi:hypothetical protein